MTFSFKVREGFQKNNVHMGYGHDHVIPLYFIGVIMPDWAQVRMNNSFCNYIRSLDNKLQDNVFSKTLFEEHCT